MSFFPFCMDIRDKVCLIIGGGSIALRKAEVLAEFDAEIWIVALRIDDSFYKWKDTFGGDKEIKLIERGFLDNDVLNADIVVAATDNKELNTHISDLCKTYHKLVNVVDVPKESTFIFPAVIKKKDLLISVSTNGRSPMFASEIKTELQDYIPDYYAELVDMLGECRDYVNKYMVDSNKKKEIYKNLITQGKKMKGRLNSVIIEQIIAESLV